ncbi:MAG: sugar transferase [Deltaproteobacteria bacterium]|nr:sugar transferase [Deltaproteobacteria bacterium]
MIRFPSSLLTISMEASGFVVAAAQRFQRQGRELATQIGTRTRERIRGLEEGWGRLNKMPDPDRRVPLENADIGLLSAQIFTAPSTGYRLFEEIAGRGVALAGALFVYFPLTPIIALAIKLDSRGPVFYRQARLGLGGVPFEILKFRTMHMTHTTPVPIPLPPKSPGSAAFSDNTELMSCHSSFMS